METCVGSAPLRVVLDTHVGANGGTYSSGDLVNGTVFVDGNELGVARAVSIKLSGVARVEFRAWPDEDEKHDSTSKVPPSKQRSRYQVEEVIVAESKLLFNTPTAGAPKRQSSLALRFSLPLPTSAPPSFGSTHTSIVYFLIATLNRHQLVGDKSAEVSVTMPLLIVAPCIHASLSATSPLTRIVARTVDVHYRTFFSGTKRLAAVVTLSKDSLRPGELADLAVELPDLSTLQLQALEWSLLQRAVGFAQRQFHARSTTTIAAGVARSPHLRQHVEERALMSRREQLPTNHDKPRRYRITIIMPSVVPTLRSLAVLEIKYALKITLITASGRRASVELPVVIDSGGGPMLTLRKEVTNALLLAATSDSRTQ